MCRPLSRQNGTARLRALAIAAGLVVALTTATVRAQAPGAPPAELPADFLEGGKPPGNLGPEPTPLGEAEPPSKAAPAPAEAPPEPLPLGEPPSLPPPGEAVGLPAAADVDTEVKPAQAPGAQSKPVAPVGGGLPLAVEKPGAAPAAAPAAAPPVKGDASFVLPPERLPYGRQTVGLTVDVVAPQFINIQQDATFKVVVRNTGQTDAMGVVVRDELPDGLTYVGSQPEPTRIDNLLSWELETIPAGSERTISLTVRPTRTGPFDHAATLSLKAGAKYRTLVREPKLKVEQTANTTRVLKGQPVQFKIVVSNPGDGPVRNVTVQAKLSAGLRHESGEPNDQNLFEQSIDLINPGDRLVLDTLIADAIQGGEQSCTVVVHSADVVANLPGSRSEQAVTVVEPRLALTVAGPKERYTDTLATYDIVVTNPGTATAENVKVQATVPVSGRLFTLPPGARFDAQTRRLSWTHGPLEPGGKVNYSLQLRMGGVGLYQVAAESRADGGVVAKEIAQTDVTGLADVDLTVSENRRFIDVSDTTTFVIKVVNRGTADATNIQISSKLTDTILPIETSGTEKVVSWDQKDTLMFPLIERLGPGKMMELGIKVKATKAGAAFCRVFLMHDGMKDKQEQLDDVAVCKIMTARK